MCNTMFKKYSWCNTDAGLLVLRLGVGAIFIYSGYMKATDMTMTLSGFATMGFNAFWAYLVTVVELLGGMAVLLGVYTRLAAVPLTITMIVATYVLRSNMAMIFSPLMLFFASLALVLAGSGKYSVAQKMCNCESCDNCTDHSTSPTK